VLADDSVDAVILTTLHSTHAEQVIAAAAAGKHVFCEKPFTLTRASAQAAVDACAEAGVVLAIGPNRRRHSAARVLKPVTGDGEGMLIIDDLADTGATARIVREMLPTPTMPTFRLLITGPFTYAWLRSSYCTQGQS